MARTAVRRGLVMSAVALALLGCSVEERSRGTAGETQPGSAATSPPPLPEPSPVGPLLLLPNLRTLPAEQVQAAQEDGRRVLRFGAALANAGPGPLRLLPAPTAACPSGQRGSRHVVVKDVDGDGRFRPRVDRAVTGFATGCMLFHRGHDHWHFDSFAGYRLTSVDGRQVLARSKVSFCLRDSRRLRGAPVTHAAAYGDCTRDGRQGISPGWADVYEADLPGQALPLPPGLAAGTYCLEISADPDELIRETDEGDNRTTTPVRITAGGAARGSPGGCGT